MIEWIETGKRMSRIVRCNGVAYLCGPVGDGATMGAQARDRVRRIEALLKGARTSSEQVLQAIIRLADLSDFDGMNAVWNPWIPDGCAPAHACDKAKLARAGLKVEIIVTAAYDP